MTAADCLVQVQERYPYACVLGFQLEGILLMMEKKLGCGRVGGARVEIPAMLSKVTPR